MGGLSYIFNVAYGVGKAGCDRMAADCALELKSRGPVKTEYIKDNLLESKAEKTLMSKEVFAKGETIEFSGKAVASLAADKGIMAKTGRIFFTSDLAREYGFTEDDGSLPVDFRQVSTLMELQGYTWLSSFIPSFIRIPKWMLHFGSFKF